MDLGKQDRTVYGLYHNGQFKEISEEEFKELEKASHKQATARVS